MAPDVRFFLLESTCGRAGARRASLGKAPMGDGDLSRLLSSASLYSAVGVEGAEEEKRGKERRQERFCVVGEEGGAAERPEGE